MAKAKTVSTQLKEPAYERVRALCLSLPTTTEALSWGHPNFRTKKRVYVALEAHEGRPSIAIRLVADQVQELCAQGNFFPTRYGKGLWASTYADRRLNWTLLKRLIQQAHSLSLTD
jgi:predicted DNA-binding protein (MmcQ/YjbR family)